MFTYFLQLNDVLSYLKNTEPFYIWQLVEGKIRCQFWYMPSQFCLDHRPLTQG